MDTINQQTLYGIFVFVTISREYGRYYFLKYFLFENILKYFLLFFYINTSKQ
jgi:hypothetical protein